MEGYKNIKKWLTVTLVFLILTLVSALGILVFNNSNKKSSNDKYAQISIAPMEKLELNMGSSHFYIANQTQFDYFVNVLNGEAVTILFGTTFEHKTIELWCNVVAKNVIRRKFAGHFYGEGHTIDGSNITIDTDISFFGDQKAGFFSHVAEGASVNDTNFKNFSYHVTASNSATTETYVGVIAGKNEGTVKNCKVENCKFISDRLNSYCKVAPLVAYNKGTVKHCYVGGKYEIGGYNTNGWLNPDGVNGFKFVALENSATYCVYDVTESKVGCQESIDKKLVLFQTESNLSNTCCTDTSSVGSLGDTQSAEGGKSVSGQPWYYASEYYDMPLLRIFIKWKDVEFIKGDGVDEIDPASIQLPKDAAGKIISSTENAISLYGQKVTAIKSPNYCVDSKASWTKNSDTSYTVSFVRSQFTVTVKPSGDASFTPQTFTKNCCESISSSCAQRSRFAIIEGVKFEIDDKFYIENATEVNNYDGKSVTTKMDIVIKTKRKTYSIAVS